ncbi:hypothetical protein ISN44_As11g007740 [Arabidopsis suecica]|uniref:KIB1-4 beta-propeller domain-containing protein n=1 Tax=Arabidopsis suecica TaxID=45249 RepID=A0A8T1Z876_ARASU|nr:hypothetical protein ISN44_As11g007740 [Arabidopsis suecica]
MCLITLQRHQHLGGVRFLSETPLCHIVGAERCGSTPRDGDIGKLVINDYTESSSGTIKVLEKTVPMDLMKETGTIGASHGWVVTLKDGVVRLQDDLNPSASDSFPKRISLPPLVTLPHCQTQFVTNVAMSSSSPEDDDCIVAVKFAGPQLSLCRPARSEWVNIRVEDPHFFFSRVMYSRRDKMFSMLSSSGSHTGSWDLGEHMHKPKIQLLQYFTTLPEFVQSELQILDSCCTAEHLVESRPTGEFFLVKSFRERNYTTGRMESRHTMVFKLDEEGFPSYTNNIGDLCIFLSESEPFCLKASLSGQCSNMVYYIENNGRGIRQHHLGGVRFLSETPLCHIVGAEHCGSTWRDGDVGKLVICNFSASPCGTKVFEKEEVPKDFIAPGCGKEVLEKTVPMDLMKATGTIGASHGWVATLRDGVVCLQDDLNPSASDSYPKRISLPPLVTLPHCQTQMVTNVAMSSSSPEDDDCIVAVKFLGPQLSLCRPARSEWVNIRIEDPGFFSSRVMYSRREEMFSMLGSGGKRIGFWDLEGKQIAYDLVFPYFPEFLQTEWNRLLPCSRSEHLVDSPTGETFLVKWYTMYFPGHLFSVRFDVFKVVRLGLAILTEDIGDLCIFLSYKGEPFCLQASLYDLSPNFIYFLSTHDFGKANIRDIARVRRYAMVRGVAKYPAPYFIPPLS